MPSKLTRLETCNQALYNVKHQHSKHNIKNITQFWLNIVIQFDCCHLQQQTQKMCNVFAQKLRSFIFWKAIKLAMCCHCKKQYTIHMVVAWHGIVLCGINMLPGVNKTVGTIFVTWGKKINMTSCKHYSTLVSSGSAGESQLGCSSMTWCYIASMLPGW